MTDSRLEDGIPAKSEEDALDAVRSGRLALDFVPGTLRTESMCLDAVRKDGMALEFVPEGMKTLGLCLDAVSQTGMALRFVPQALRTEAVCLHAVRRDGRALRWVPEALRTADVCLVAVRTWHDGEALEHVPADVLNAEICLAMADAGVFPERLPARFRTRAVWEAAVLSGCAGLEQVPGEMLDEEFCFHVARAGRWRAGDMNQNEAKLLAGTRQVFCGKAMLPEKAAHGLLWAQRRFGWNFVMSIVRRRPAAVACFPLGALDSAVYAEAVRRNGSLLHLVPHPMRTPALCALAVLQDRRAMDGVPERLRSLVAVVALRILASGRKRQALKES